MTIVRRCDVCGRTTEDFDDTDDNRLWGSITYTYDASYPGDCYHDLCPQCIDKVRELVKSLATASDPTKEDPECKDSGMTFLEARKAFSEAPIHSFPIIRRKAWSDGQKLTANYQAGLRKVRQTHYDTYFEDLTEEDIRADDWEVIV